MLTKELKRLSRTEKILLAQDLWDNIATEAAPVPVDDDERAYVEPRLLELADDETPMISWDQLKRLTKNRTTRTRQ